MTDDRPRVTISFGEFILAGTAGVMRQASALRAHLHDPDAHHRDPSESHVAGAQAEYALSMYLGVPWHPTIGIRWAGEVDGDVGTIEVRSTFRPNGSLLGHDYSFDDRPYVLALSHLAPTYIFAGWLMGHELKQQPWREDLPRPAFAARQDVLRHIDTLPTRVHA